MKHSITRILAGLALPALCAGMYAQTSADAGCNVAMPSLNTHAPNIFNEAQEQALGDAMAEWEEAYLRIAAPTADDQLTRIGQRLLAVLPPTKIHFTFRIYDSGEINAFSTAGGHVYVSRKLIAAAKNEDELAAVVAHEIGHLMTHQMAIDYTRMLRMRLGVTQLGDRADVFARFHQLWSTKPRYHENEHEEGGELTADRVGLFAMVRAGYAAENAAAFFNLVSSNKGKTGNWLSDTFGITHQASQRYRAVLKLIAALPEGCKGRPPEVNAAFEAWRQRVINERLQTAAEDAKTDQPIKLEAPLRAQPWQVRFSPDGHYVLVQDDGSITVVNREAGKAQFQVQAPDANVAQFTPDSKNLIFSDVNLRVEKWDVATGKRTSVKELVVFDGCNQSFLSPDGKTLVCINVKEHSSSLRVGLRLIDVDTGKPYYEKPDFYTPSIYDWVEVDSLYYRTVSGSNIVNVAIAPDSRYLIASAGNQALAYDLANRQPVMLRGKLKGLTQLRIAFYGPDKVVLMTQNWHNGMAKLETLSFPDGALIKENDIGNQNFRAATRGPYLLIWPLQDYAIGLFDLNQNKLTEVSRQPSLDAWDTQLATEDAVGGLSLEQMGKQQTRRIDLPIGPLPTPKAAIFSPDGKYLIVSLSDRAAIWDLSTGKQLRLIRPFLSGWIDRNDEFFGQFPKFRNWDATELEFSVSPFMPKTLSRLDDGEWQYRDFELRMKPLSKEKSTRQHATLEVKKMASQAVAWTRAYPHETPACWPAEDDRMVLAWDLSGETARAEIRHFPQLQKEETDFKDKKKGILIETVKPETGAPLQQVLIPEADLSGGWNDRRRARVAGDYILAQGEHGNTVIYRLSDGTKIGEFFGWVVAVSTQAGLVAAINRDEEVLLVDMKTGKELQRGTLGSPVRAARIVNGKDGRLLVLTADQTVHRLPLPNRDGAPSAASP